jgi:eukaryotic-like serine/threonine-protein kinase
VTPFRWRRVEEIYTEALGYDSSARAAFLDKECGCDAALREEVSSLLEAGERTSVFLSSPRFESALRSMSEFAPSPQLPAVPLRTSRPAFFWIAIALAVAVIAFQACTAWIVFGDQGGKSSGWEFVYTRPGWVVLEVDPTGPAAGKLLPGDRVLAMDGDSRVERTGPSVVLPFLAPGTDYSLRIARGQVVRDLALKMLPWEDSNRISKAITYFLLSLTSLATGLALGLLKPRNRVAQIGCATLAVAAVRHLAGPLNAHLGTAPDMAYSLNQIASFTFPGVLALAYHFFYKFSSPAGSKFPWAALRNILYGITAVVLVSQLAFFVTSLFGRGALLAFAWQRFWLAELNVVFTRAAWEACLTFALAAICGVIVWGYRRTADLDRRRRIRWFAAGCAIGFAPQLILNFAGLLISSAGSAAFLQTRSWYNLRWAADLFLAVPPVSLTYAVLKHRLLDIHVVVRRGIRYVLARRVLQAILLLPFLGLVLPIVANPNRTVRDTLLQTSSAVNLILMALIGLSLKYGSAMQAWLDRRFFREAYRQEEILHRLMARIKDLDSADEVSRLVCDELDSALHPKWLYVCQWKGESGRPSIVAASGRGAMAARAPAPGILRLLEACDVMREFSIPGEGDLASHPSRAERLLVVPVTAGAGGALLLGEKESEEPYTETDRHLLDCVAGAVAVVFENFWLKRRVDQGDRERHEVLGRLDRSSVKLMKECPLCGECFDGPEETCPADHADLTLTLPVERTIAARYRLDRRIAKGGMGVVYVAFDSNLSRPVAVKVMMGHLFGDRSALRRFEREARVLARLSHPNIVAIYDFGRLGGQGAFLVMELLDGRSWRVEINRLGRIPPSTLSVWFEQLSGALGAAHQAGIVHRDLKPENLMIAASDNGGDLLKVLDFGLAREAIVQSAAAPTATLPGTVMGTLAYMSPEQLRGEPVDERSDLFSVGLLTVEALTGKLPPRDFRGAIDADALFRDIEAEGRSHRAELHRVFMKYLAAAPAGRCSSAMSEAGELIRALRRYDSRD